MKSSVFLLIAIIICISNAQSQNDPNTYLGDAKQKLDEQIDISFVCEELTTRVYKISEEIKRFEYSKFNSFSTSGVTTFNTSEPNPEWENTVYSGRKRVIILPFISAEEAKNNPDFWTSSIENAKGTDAHYLIRGVIENATAEPKLKEGGSQGNTRTYAGFEGSILFSIQIYDLEQDVELEDSKLSDRGLLKSDVIKSTTDVLNVGSRLLGKGNLGQATKTGVNTLVDQTLAQTKKDAMYEAINRSEKYLRQLFSETFPMYFPIVSLTESPKNGIEIKFLNYPDSELIKGHKIDLIFLDQKNEENFGTQAIEILESDSFTVSVNGKQAEKLKQLIEENGEDKFFAKFGKEKLTMKAKFSNIL